jgi:fatty acid desaturase
VTATTADHGAYAPAPPQHGKVRRYLLGPGWIRAVWMTALFAALGFGLVVVLRWWGGWHPLLDWQPIVLVSALVSAPLGFLAGIGTFDYWVY